MPAFGGSGMTVVYWVNRNTDRDATVAIKVWVFLNHIVGNLLLISAQYFLYL